MIREIHSYAQGEWASWFPGASSDSLRCAVIARSAVHPRRAVLAIFSGAESEPRATIKVALDGEGQFLQQEYEALATLRRIMPVELAKTMPQALALDWIGRSRVAAFTVLRGRQVNLPAFSLGGGWLAVRRTERLLGRIMQWAASFGAVRAAGTGKRLRLDHLRTRFQALSRGTVATDAWSAMDNCLDVAAAPLRACWQHGDLAVGNVLVYSDGVGIVDWECAANDYEPWFDQSYALAAILFHAWAESPTTNLADVTRRVLSAHGWLGAVMQRTSAAYWRFPIPIGAGVATACMRAAVRSHASGRSGWERWRDMAAVLVTDRSWKGGEWLWKPQARSYA